MGGESETAHILSIMGGRAAITTRPAAPQLRRWPGCTVSGIRWPCVCRRSRVSTMVTWRRRLWNIAQRPKQKTVQSNSVGTTHRRGKNPEPHTQQTGACLMPTVQRLAWQTPAFCCCISGTIPGNCWTPRRCARSRPDHHRSDRLRYGCHEPACEIQSNSSRRRSWG